MSIDQRLRTASDALGQAIDGGPPPLARRRSLTGSVLLIVSLVAAGGWLVLLQGNDEGSVGPAPVQLDAGTTDGQSGSAEIDTTRPENSVEEPIEEPTDEPIEEQAFHALALDPPAGWSLERATVLDRRVLDQDVGGAIDLLVRPAGWLPIGGQVSMKVSVQSALFRNPAESEVVMVRGREATLLIDGPASTLTWEEDVGIYVVVTSSGYSKEDILAVAEGLSIDRDRLTADAGPVPEGSTATPGSELVMPSLWLLYVSEDGSEATVLVSQIDRTPTEVDREILRNQQPEADLTIVERPEGIGVSYLAHGEEPVIDWWTQDGLLLVLRPNTGDVVDDGLVDLAATVTIVDSEVWETAWGE